MSEINKSCPQCGSQFKPRHALSLYCSRSCARKNNGAHKRRKPEVWWLNGRGYIEGRVWIGDRQRQVKQHRLVVERAIGRSLKPDEDVHHINGDKTDNRIENLQVLSHGQHARITSAGRAYVRGKTYVYSEEERKRRSERMKRLHETGRVMPPQMRKVRAALQKATPQEIR